MISLETPTSDKNNFNWKIWRNVKIYFFNPQTEKQPNIEEKSEGTDKVKNFDKRLFLKKKMAIPIVPMVDIHTWAAHWFIVVPKVERKQYEILDKRLGSKRSLICSNSIHVSKVT